MKKLVNLEEILKKQETQIPKLGDFRDYEEPKYISLLKLLLAGYALSKLQILQHLDLFNSGEAIRRLRNKGYNIKTKMMSNVSKKSTFAVYYMPEYCDINEC